MLGVFEFDLSSPSGPFPVLSAFDSSERDGFRFILTSVLFFTETEIGVDGLYPVALALIE